MRWWWALVVALSRRLSGSAAQTFIGWAKRGVRERLRELAQAGGADLGMAFLDGTNVRAHHGG